MHYLILFAQFLLIEIVFCFLISTRFVIYSFQRLIVAPRLSARIVYHNGITMSTTFLTFFILIVCFSSSLGNLAYSIILGLACKALIFIFFIFFHFPLNH